MTDIVDVQTRSRMMSNIRSRNTKPEVSLRQTLHREGFRFRINVRGLPGSPDIVLPKWQTVVLVHGCFWHQHPGCSKATVPNTNTEFWSQKFEANRRRDVKVLEQLHALGWRTAIVWECAITPRMGEELVHQLGEFVRGAGGQHMEFGS
ncbi:very short patch repair endonuclease [Roseibium sp. RKSG952]|uniref:very short patch repair endonuclease n=1 Tax=Roseibium sp. RKSG952 TaxID=2529384 RepID=UPI0012BB79EC|nr:DNA mismatch endonuclease Vsr [Roseibium sp. RKSG952]MTI01649.1 DNA mismatch endonuclease Vsr [Roseibium sp. RKSG952]